MFGSLLAPRCVVAHTAAGQFATISPMLAFLLLAIVAVSAALLVVVGAYLLIRRWLARLTMRNKKARAR